MATITPPEYKGRTLDDAFNQAKANRSPEFIYNGRLYKSVELDPMAGAWARVPPKPAPATWTTELQRYQNSTFYKQRNGLPVGPEPVTPAPLPTVLRATMSDGRTSRAGTRRLSPVRVRPVNPITTDNYTVQAGDTLGLIAHRMGVDVNTLATINKIVNPSYIQAGQVISRTGTPATLPATPVMPDLTQRQGEAIKTPLAQTVGAGITPAGIADKLKTTAPPTALAKPGIDLDNLAGNVADLGRLVAGVIMAGKRTPTYKLPQAYSDWRQEVAAQKNAGLSAGEWATANAGIADTYAAGVNAQTNALGGGATAGTVLSGLARLGQIRGDQTVRLGQVDRAMRRQNFDRFGAMAGADLSLDRALFGDYRQQVAAEQATGAGLIGAGLQNIESRRLYNDAYGPGSRYQRLMNAQIEREEAEKELLNTYRKKVGFGS